MEEIKEIILKYQKPRYHLIRTKTGSEQEADINNVKQFFGEDDYKYLNYDMDSLSQETEFYDEETKETEFKTELDILLENQPSKHTFIFLKEKARCAKTFKKKHIGIWYERFAKKFADDVVTQGLLGRATGYDDNGDSVIFSNLESIDKFERLWKSNFEDKSVKWNSNSTSFKSGMSRSKGTFNSVVDKNNRESFIEEPEIKKFGTQEEVKKYYNEVLKVKYPNIFKGRGPNRKKQNTNGFYEANIRNSKGIITTKKNFEERRCNISNGAGYAIRPCYRDITDKSTLEWWLIYYIDKK